jgi:putative endopeptidase
MTSTGLSWLTWRNLADRRRAARSALANRHRFFQDRGGSDYTALAVRPGPFWSNVLSARRFETAHQLAKIGRPVDRNEWLQSPHAVDGHFDERLNRANVAAGLLQPPYFDLAGDDAANYATIGSTVAHELIHGFDARGRKFEYSSEHIETHTRL